MTDTVDNYPDSTEYAAYYGRYISLVPRGGILATLAEQLDSTRALLGRYSEARGDWRYAPDKWSIKELVGHVIDAERVFTYRALRFARNDQTALAGFEQDDWVRNAEFGRTQLTDLAAELAHVRLATIDLFRRLKQTEWQRRGVASNAELSVRALAYIIAGHEKHHVGILTTRYPVEEQAAASSD
jgi:DinB superfamily